MSDVYLYDKQGNQYTPIVENEDDYFNATIRYQHLFVGRIQWFVRATGILEIADIEIHEQPIDFSRGCWLLHRFKSPAKNFRQLGLGTAMLEYIITQAKEAGVDSIYGGVVPKDALATPYLLDWYKRHGFIVVDEANHLPNATATIYRKM